MELRQLRYLDAVARHRHFSRAAEELHVAQSALSSQIRRLESELGIELFNRTTRSVELTEAGAVALARARGAIAEADALSHEVLELRGLVRGTVAIGALLPAGEVDVPALLQRFNQAHPGIEIEFREGTATELVEHLRAGRLDAAFALEWGEPVHGLGRLRLSSEELVVAVSRRDPLAKELGGLPVAALDGQPLIAFRRGSAVRRALDEVLAANGARPRIRLEGSDLVLIRALAARGFGLAVLPRSFAELPGQPLAIRPLAPPVRMEVALLWREEKRPAPAARAFVEFVAEAAGAAG